MSKNKLLDLQEQITLGEEESGVDLKAIIKEFKCSCLLKKAIPLVSSIMSGKIHLKKCELRSFDDLIYEIIPIVRFAVYYSGLCGKTSTNEISVTAQCGSDLNKTDGEVTLSPKNKISIECVRAFHGVGEIEFKARQYRQNHGTSPDTYAYRQCKDKEKESKLNDIYQNNPRMERVCCSTHNIEHINHFSKFDEACCVVARIVFLADKALSKKINNGENNTGYKGATLLITYDENFKLSNEREYEVLHRHFKYLVEKYRNNPFSKICFMAACTFKPFTNMRDVCLLPV